jgi:hypothetical protein
MGVDLGFSDRINYLSEILTFFFKKKFRINSLPDSYYGHRKNAEKSVITF